MTKQELQLRVIFAPEQLRRTRGSPSETGTMKTIASNATTNPRIRSGVNRGDIGQCPVESSIENGDLRRLGAENLPSNANSLEVVFVMQWRKGSKVFDVAFDFFIHAYGAAVFRSAMNYPMTNRFYFFRLMQDTRIVS